MDSKNGNARFTLGAVALLVAGCSHEAPPPQTTPSFESRVTPVMTATPPPAQPDLVAPTPPVESTPAPVAADTAPPADQPAPKNQANERQLCDEIGRDAKIAVADVPGGISVTATPKGGASLASIVRDSKRIEDGMAQVAPGISGTTTAPRGESKDSCVLFDVGRQGGRVVVAEQPKSVKLTFTTPDATQVKALRSQVRDFAKTLAGNAVSESNGVRPQP